VDGILMVGCKRSSVGNESERRYGRFDSSHFSESLRLHAHSREGLNEFMAQRTITAAQRTLPLCQKLETIVQQAHG
jgi:hypothetical protein